METSEALYPRPDLVSPVYKQAPALSGQTVDEARYDERYQRFSNLLFKVELVFVATSGNKCSLALVRQTARLSTVPHEMRPLRSIHEERDSL